jgi:hypothetical protein
VGFTRPSICQALADDAACRDLGELVVSHAKGRAGVVAEIELGKVAMQTLLAAMLGRYWPVFVQTRPLAGGKTAH